MRTIAIPVSIAALLVSGVSGQSPGKGVPELERTFFLTHTDTTQQFQEVATVIRTIADIKQIAADNDRRSLTVHTSPGQIAMAEWLFNELDSPAAQPSVPHAFNLPNAGDDLVRVFYVATAPTVQDFQEIATLVRTITGIARVFTYNERRALVVRGTAAQNGLAEWLVQELEPEVTSSTHEYRMTDFPHDFNVVRVLRLPHAASTQDFQKAATQIRSATNITYIFTHNSLRAVALRGTPDQIAAAVRMAQELDKP